MDLECFTYEKSFTTYKSENFPKSQIFPIFLSKYFQIFVEVVPKGKTVQYSNFTLLLKPIIVPMVVRTYI